MNRTPFRQEALVSGPLPIAKPRITYVLLGIIVLLWLADEFSRNQLLLLFGMIPSKIAQGGEYWRLFTASFMHIGVEHILFNGYSLYVLGMQVEALFGQRRFLAIYLLSGLSGVVMSYLFSKAGLSAGASTALFGLFGALVVFFYKQRETLGNASRRQLTQLGLVLLVNVVIGLSPGSRIDNFGHAGGFIGGLVLAWFLCPRYVPSDPIGDLIDNALTKRARPELANASITDANTLAANWLVIGAFVLALVALVGLGNILRGG